MHTAKTYGCVKLIEAALTRPAHRPAIIRPHLADEYQDRHRHHPDQGSKDARELREIGQELRRSWMRYLVAPVSPAPLGRGRTDG